MLKSQRVTFPGAFGHGLAARLDHSDEASRAVPPEGGKPTYALFAHCFTCSKDLKATARISRALVERGFAVLRFDFTGLGESAGDFADTNFSSNVDDLLAAVEYLRREHEAPKLLVGHSLGGAAVLAMASRVPEAVAVATIGAPSDTEHLGEGILRRAPELEAAGEAEVVLAGRPFRVKRQLVDDLAGQGVLDAVRHLGRALLILHSPVDETVDVDHARRIFLAARHPKSFVSLDTADHLLLKDPADARYVADVLAAWAGRYVEDRPESRAEGSGLGRSAGSEGLGQDLEPEARDPGALGEPAEEQAAAPAEAALEHGEVRVVGPGSGYRQRVHAGRHALTADEPESVGGTDAGPNPYDYLLAGLGACTNMTLRMYADRKGWPLEGVDTLLEHSKIHADDCRECQTEKGKIDLIEKEIELRGPLDEAQRQRLLEIAERCPVHRTLTSETVIRSRLA